MKTLNPLICKTFHPIYELKKLKLSEASIARLCVIISVIGLVIIYLMESSYSPDLYEIGDITESESGKYVKVCGTAEDPYSSENIASFDLENKVDSIKIIIFQTDTSLDLPEFIEEDESVCVQGTVEIYKNSLEIIAKKITKLDA